MSQPNHGKQTAVEMVTDGGNPLHVPHDTTTADGGYGRATAVQATTGTTAYRRAAVLTKADLQQTRAQAIAALADETIACKCDDGDTCEYTKSARNKRLLKAVFGEFVCTLLFFTAIFGFLGNAAQNNFTMWETLFPAAFQAGLMAVAVIYSFASVSGANFNPSISFALWVTGKMSSTKLLLYISVQLLASFLAMALIGAMFVDIDGDTQQIYDICTLSPVDNNRMWKVFATEFVLTFVVTYVAFTYVYEEAETEKKNNMSFQSISEARGLTVYATTPQSKSGFAPFVIGFCIFSLILVGGASGAAFNQARIFGPAVMSGKWTGWYVYYIAEFMGAGAAALMVHNLRFLGLEHQTTKPELSAAQAVAMVEGDLEQEQNHGDNAV